MTDNAKIVEVAGLMLKLDQYKNEDDPACLEDSARFEQAVKGLSQAEMMAVNMAYKLRQGKPYMVCSDNQEEIGGYKSLAEYMGATVEEVEEPVEATRKHFLFGALDEEAREKVLENKTTIIIRPVGGSRH